MKTEFQIKDPDQLEATLIVRATVGEFRKMREQAKAAPGSWAWPIGGLIDSLDLLLTKSDERFETHPTPKKDEVP